MHRLLSELTRFLDPGHMVLNVDALAFSGLRKGKALISEARRLSGPGLRKLLEAG